ncbi:MAG: hypothetical protein ACTSRP_01850 [Candidatus Helarchaeota archaeon]
MQKHNDTHIIDILRKYPPPITSRKEDENLGQSIFKWLNQIEVPEEFEEYDIDEINGYKLNLPKGTRKVLGYILAEFLRSIKMDIDGVRYLRFYDETIQSLLFPLIIAQGITDFDLGNYITEVWKENSTKKCGYLGIIIWAYQFWKIINKDPDQARLILDNVISLWFIAFNELWKYFCI